MTTAAANGQTPGGRPPAAHPRGGEELRQLIREVLADALPALRDRLASVHRPTPPPAAAPAPAAPPTAIPAGTVAAPATPPAPAAPTALTGLTGLTGPATPPPRTAVARRGTAAPAASGPGGTVRSVRLETDEDVRQFALDIVRLAGNPARRADLIAGLLRFTLTGSQAAAARPEHRVDAGAVTERAVQAAAKAGERLVLGPRAVLTPLARDRALALGVPIEKER